MYYDFCTDKHGFKQMDFDKVKQLQIGDKVAICVCDHPKKVEFIITTVVQPMFWNSDADEPDWEVETEECYTDINSIYEVVEYYGKNKMKLNEKGKELYDIWDKNYCKENDKLGGNSANGDFVEGWCIIDNDDYVKTLTDECGLLIFGYDDNAVNIVEEWMEDYGNEKAVFGYTYEEIRNELLKYFEV